MHEPELLNEPPAPPSLKETVPVGVVFVPVSLSVTVAVKVMVPDNPIEDGLGVTAVVVVRLFTVKADVPELPE